MAEQVLRRWRGEIDVPLNEAGRTQARNLGDTLEAAGGLTLCYHDWLSRCRDTARAACPITGEVHGPRPWRMGKQFEGNPITPQSLLWAQWYVRHSFMAPEHGGEPWQKWYDEWMHFLCDLPTHLKTGIVTHNRNIQAAYSTVDGKFQEQLYNVTGPDFCTVHVYNKGHIEPWDGKELKPGIYLIRHGETEFGT